MSHAFEVALEDFTSVSDSVKPSNCGIVALELYSRARRAYAGKLDENHLNSFLKSTLKISPAALRRNIGQKALHEVRSYAISGTYLVARQSLVKGFGKFMPVSGKEDLNWLDEYVRLIHHLALCVMYSYIAHKGGGKPGQKKSRFLYAIRQLVDGQVDGDRLDYTLRDCRSAGAHFGEFDIERIIQNAILVQKYDMRNNKAVPSGVFSFGFGPRAVPGIEQFFESRYQGYRYLVHHRTASRSNVLIQLLLQKFYEYAYRYPESRCAAVMDKLEFVRVETNNGSKSLVQILPSGGDDGEILDDASLRVLMKRCRQIIRRPGNLEELRSENEERWREAKLLDVLIEILMFRELQHTETLFKEQTVSTYLQEKLNISDKDERQKFAAEFGDVGPLRRAVKEINKRIAAYDWSVLGYHEPLAFCAEQVLPKCFKSKDVQKHVFEEFTWIVEPSGALSSVDTGEAAPTLHSMQSARAANTGIRFYAAGRDLKEHPKVVTDLQKIVTGYIKEEYAGFVRRKKNPKS